MRKEGKPAAQVVDGRQIRLVDGQLPLLAAMSLLGAFLLLSLHTARSKSVTFDEVAHLPAGYTHLVWGDFRLNPEQPPLVKELAAAPLALSAVDTPSRESRTWIDAPLVITNHWEFGRQFLFEVNRRQVDRLVFLGRIPMVAMALAAGALLWLWARELFAPWVAVGALALLVLDPNWLGHGSLVTLDAPFALCWLGSSYFLWRLTRAVTITNVVGATVFLALAQVTKFNAPMLAALVALFSGVVMVRRAPWRTAAPALPGRLERRRLRGAAALALIVVFAAGAVGAIWAAYRFRLAPTPGGGEHFPVAMRLGELRVLARQPGGWQAAVIAPLASFAHRHSLLPEAYVYGLASTVSGARERIAYLHGRFSMGGWWYYFPAAMAVKSPLPTLILAALGAVLLGRRRLVARVDAPGLLLAVAPGLLYLAMSMLTGINIGIRHVLPVYPSLYLLAAAGVSWLLARPGRARLLLGALGLWLAVGTAAVHPHHLAYFNELAGGPKNGARWLLDSNIDWGQDLKTLKRWLDERGVSTVNLAYWGTADPAAYGIDYVQLPGLTMLPDRPAQQPELPGYVAISVNNLFAAPPEIAAAYRRWTDRGSLEARVGYSIYVYRVP